METVTGDTPNASATCLVVSCIWSSSIGPSWDRDPFLPDAPRIPRALAAVQALCRIHRVLTIQINATILILEAAGTGPEHERQEPMNATPAIPSSLDRALAAGNWPARRPDGTFAVASSTRPGLDHTVPA